VREVAKSARNLRTKRNELVVQNKFTLREIYIGLEDPGDSPLKEAHRELDNAVWRAYYYGLPKDMQKLDTLGFILKLNEFCANEEKVGNTIIGPGLPSFCNKEEFVSEDCVRFEKQD
jgi:hypothetical protein